MPPGACALAGRVGGDEDEARQPRPGHALKAFGTRLPKCTAQSFHHKVAEHLPEELAPALGPILETIALLTERIREYDRRLESVADEQYPETKLLRQVHGVGALSALARSC